MLGVSISGVALTSLHSYLVSRLDVQVGDALGRASNAVQGRGPSPQDDGQGPGADARQNFYTITARLTSSGRIASYEGVPQIGISGDNGDGRLSVSTDVFASVPVDGTGVTVDLGGSLRFYRVAAERLPDGSRILVGLPFAEADATLAQLSTVLVIVVIAAILLSLLAGLLIVRLALRPLARVAATAQRVATLPLDRGEVVLGERVPERDTDPRTEVGRVGSAFNRMLGHVQAALQSRETSERKVRQFVADASHELRTPLASIRGYAELTRRGPHVLPPEVIRSVGRIESEATRMTAIVEDLLLLARLDEGRELGREEVDLLPLLIDSVSDAHAAGPDHSWSLDLPEEAMTVAGDPARLQQVIVNLLANARVHTPEGTRVRAATFREGDAVVVTVSDDGPGIPPELAGTLFERFARGDASRSRETGSTGLGLAIVQAVVEAHGGTVGVVSAPRSTTFRVELPAV